MQTGPEKRGWLEANLRARLQYARTERAGSLAQDSARRTVVRTASGRSQNEVGAIKDVEGRPFKLQVDFLRNFEGLGHRHIGFPGTGAYKCIAPQVAHAT